MKYAQLIMGLLIGTALGGVVVGGVNVNAVGVGGGAIDKAAVQQIIRETLPNEGALIIQAANKYQAEQQQQRNDTANAALKNETTQNAIYHDPAVAFIGPKNASRIVAEFFDYNCPACKMQSKAIAQLVEKDKGVKVVFHEYPIFGPQSETNSKIGLGVFHVAPEKYFLFHEKMMANPGRADETTAYKFVKEAGVNVEKVKAYASSPEAQAALDKSRELGTQLGIQGTPSVFIGTEMIPHAVELQEIEARLQQSK